MLARALAIALVGGAAVASVAAPSPATGHEVVGGAPEEPGAHPAVVAVLYADGVLCTGALVRANAVLTAAHCLERASPTDRPVVAVADDLRGGIARSDIATVRSIHLEPRFAGGTGTDDGLAELHDLGLLVLDRPLDLEPLPLLEPGQAELAEGTEVTLVGYGVFDRASGALGQKHVAHSQIVAVSSHELQVGAAGTAQSCHGDSGGPALVRVGDLDRIAGGVSRAVAGQVGCTAGGIATRVDAYVDWIDATLAEHAADPGPAIGGCQASPGPGGAWVLVGLLGLRSRSRSREVMRSGALDQGGIADAWRGNM